MEADAGGIMMEVMLVGDVELMTLMSLRLRLLLMLMLMLKLLYGS